MPLAERDWLSVVVVRVGSLRRLRQLPHKKNPGPLRYRDFKVACSRGNTAAFLFRGGTQRRCLSLFEKGAMKFRPSPPIFRPVMVPWRNSCGLLGTEAAVTFL